MTVVKINVSGLGIESLLFLVFGRSIAPPKKASTTPTRLKPKNLGFEQVDIHLMPNLPGATVKGDTAMFDRVLSDPDLQADQWKVCYLLFVCVCVNVCVCMCVCDNPLP